MGKLRDDETYAQDEAAQSDNLQQIFNAIDADKNGEIDQNEIKDMWTAFKKAFKKAAEKEDDLIKDLRVLDEFDFAQMEKLDYNKDGKFDFVEFTDMIDYMYKRLSQ